MAGPQGQSGFRFNPSLRLTPRTPPPGASDFLRRASGPPRYDPAKFFPPSAAQQDMNDVLNRAAQRILNRPLPDLPDHQPSVPGRSPGDVSDRFVGHDAQRDIDDALRDSVRRILSKPLPELPEHKPTVPPIDNSMRQDIDSALRRILHEGGNRFPGNQSSFPGPMDGNRPPIGGPFGYPGGPGPSGPGPLEDMWRRGQTGGKI